MAKSFDRKRVGGLVFAPSSTDRERYAKQGLQVHVGLESWAEKGYPENSLVYDLAGALVDLNVPLLDAVYYNGMYLRTESVASAREARIGPLTLRSRSLLKFPPGLVTLSEHGILMVTEEAWEKASGHGKMSRGLAHRKGKAKK